MDKNKYYLQIDLLKAVAIISVIIIHTIPYGLINQYLFFNLIYSFIIIEAIPIFLIIMGINTGLSFKRNSYESLDQIFTRLYFRKRIRRFVYPLLVAFVISILIGFIFHKNLNFGFLNIMGYLPLTGPGNYFISLVLQFIIIFPFIYIIYLKKPRLMLFLSFSISLIFEVIMANTMILQVSELYNACILRYIFAITLGLWAADSFNPEEFKKFFHNKLFITGVAISIAYIIASSFLSFKFPSFIFTPSNWGSQNVFSFFYPLLLIIVGIRFLPSKSENKIVRFFVLIGKASYHIFLLQIIYFGGGFTFASVLGGIVLFKTINIYFLGILTILMNLVICLGFGLVFFLIGKNWNSFKNYLN